MKAKTVSGVSHIFYLIIKKKYHPNPIRNLKTLKIDVSLFPDANFVEFVTLVNSWKVINAIPLNVWNNDMNYTSIFVTWRNSRRQLGIL